MVLPKELQKKIEEVLASRVSHTLVRGSQTLSENYLSGKWTLNEEQMFAYLAVRLPATLAVQQKIVSQLMQTAPIKSLLDFGAGPGTASFAFPEDVAITHVEKERAFIEIGKRLSSRGTWLRTLPQTPCEGVLASFSFGEISPLHRESLIKKLWHLTKKWILIIEPGTPQGYRNILQVREALIELGGKVISPCPHSLACPLKEPKWCHFPVHVERTSLHKRLKSGQLGYETEKYSYVVVAKESLEVEGPRIIDHPKNRRRHILFNVCLPSGDVQTRILSKKHGELYQKAKRLHWGDRIELPENNENSE